MTPSWQRELAGDIRDIPRGFDMRAYEAERAAELAKQEARTAKAARVAAESGALVLAHEQQTPPNDA